MDGSLVPRPPGGRGVARPVRAADGRGGGGGAPGPGGAGSGDDAAGAAAVPDGGSVAAGLVWGVLTAAVDPLSVGALASAASVPKSAVLRALERFEAAALVLRVPRGRNASDLWVLAGGVREGIGITTHASSPGGYGHGPALLAATQNSGVARTVPEADLPVTDGLRPDGAGPLVKLPRLAKGELEAKVLAMLRERYPQEFGPLGLSRELGGYSSGAVSNSLERLAGKGLVLLTGQAPKRYAALPPEATSGQDGRAD